MNYILYYSDHNISKRRVGQNLSSQWNIRRRQPRVAAWRVPFDFRLLRFVPENVLKNYFKTYFLILHQWKQTSSIHIMNLPQHPLSQSLPPWPFSSGRYRCRRTEIRYHIFLCIFSREGGDHQSTRFDSNLNTWWNIYHMSSRGQWLAAIGSFLGEG